MGVDNGTSSLGICLLEYDFNKAKLLNLDTIAVNSTSHEIFLLELARRGRNASRRRWVQEHFIDFLEEYKPHVVAIETPFIGGRSTLNNFAPLTLSLEGLINLTYDYYDEIDELIDIERVSPFEAKRAVTPEGSKFNSSKDVILSNIKKIKDIDLNGYILEEHSLDAVDSIAVAYTVIQKLAKF